MLSNTLCAITGSSGGLGRVVVDALIQEGATIIGLDRGTSGPPSHDRHRHKTLDALSEKDVARVFSEIQAEYGRLDALIHLIGGIYPWALLHDIEPATWDATVALNLKPAYLCCREALRLMIPRGRGKIVTVGALAGLRGGAMAGPYGAAKSAVLNLTETLAEENKVHNIQVNAIVPSIIDTEANRKSMPDGDFSRWVRPEEIAHVLSFLVSDRASAVTGSVIRVTGRV